MRNGFLLLPTENYIKVSAEVPFPLEQLLSVYFYQAASVSLVSSVAQRRLSVSVRLLQRWLPEVIWAQFVVSISVFTAFILLSIYIALPCCYFGILNLYVFIFQLYTQMHTVTLTLQLSGE